MKKALATILAATMAFSLMACSSGNTAAPAPAASTAASEAAPAASEAASEAAEAASEAASEAADTAAEAGDLKVAVFYYNFTDTYIASVRAALDAQLDAAGVEYQNFDSNSNQATQNDLVNTAINDGYNLLVVNLVTSGSEDSAEEIIAAANGVPVIFFNRAIEGDGNEGKVLNAHDDICFIGTDAPEAGHLQGKMIGDYLLEHYDEVDLNGDGVISYAMMKGDEANVEAIYRTQYGQEDADAVLEAAGKPALEYFDSSNASKYQVDANGNWSAAAAKEFMDTNLAQFNEANGNMIELVICNNDNMAEGSISSLEEAGYNTGEADATVIPVFGVDATEAAQALISAGKMTGTVKQDAEGMAKAICETAVAIGGGSSVADAISSVAGGADMYSIAGDIVNKLFVAYAPFM